MTDNEEFGYLMETMGQIFLEAFAMNPIPQGARPVIEQIANRNFFTWRPIESEALKNRRPGDRYEPYTSETMRLLGEKIG